MKFTRSPLISIVIPTLQRADTLRYAIQTALDQSISNLEVIVSDDYSQDETEAVATGFSDMRVRYVNTGRRLSLCDSLEFAVAQARGDYLIVIGDDDAVVPGSLARLEETIKTTESLVYCWPVPIYLWPMNKEEARVVNIPPLGEPHEIDLKTLARRVVSAGGLRSSRLPCPYHAAVARIVCDRMRERTGRVFHSAIPDMFSSLVIPAFAPKAVKVDFYVTSHGVCQKSNGAAARNKANRSNAEAFVRAYGTYKLHPLVYPNGPLYTSLLADSMLVALETAPELYNGVKFNHSAMLANLWPDRAHFGDTENWWVIVLRRKAIRKYHRFHVRTYLLYIGLQTLFKVRRKLLQKILQFGYSRRPVPANIRDFANELAMRTRNGRAGVPARLWNRKPLDPRN